MSKYIKLNTIPYKLLLIRQLYERIDAVYEQYYDDQAMVNSDKAKLLALESDFKLYLSRLFDDIATTERRLKEDGYVLIGMSADLFEVETVEGYEYEFSPTVLDKGDAATTVNVWARRIDRTLFDAKQYRRVLEDLQHTAAQS